MLNLKKLELTDLLDFLIRQTNHHTHLIAKGATPEEFARSREILRQLQQEIEARNAMNVVPPQDISIPAHDQSSADPSK